MNTDPLLFVFCFSPAAAAGLGYLACRLGARQTEDLIYRKAFMEGRRTERAEFARELAQGQAHFERRLRAPRSVKPSAN